MSENSGLGMLPKLSPLFKFGSVEVGNKNDIFAARILTIL